MGNIMKPTIAKVINTTSIFLASMSLLTLTALIFTSDVRAGLFSKPEQVEQPTNGVIHHATMYGVQRCLPAIKKLSVYLISGNPHASHSVWHDTNPNNEMFTSVSEVKFSDGTMIIDMTVTPTAGGSCAGVYQKIFHTNMNCYKTSEMFKNDSYVGSLMSEVALMLNSQTNVKTLMMDVGSNGCMVLRKEVFPDINVLINK